jgi:photosystem II stability/assembly factor-like uncharacterized protein
VPAKFSPQSFTAIGELTWWLLGTAPCSSPPCTSIVRTDNGGRSFVGIPAPRTDQVSQLRFADATDGFAYGPQLWATHDAGKTWQRVDIAGQVSDLETSGGYVYAIARSSDGAGTLFRAPVAGGDWQPLPQAGDAYGGVWVNGSNVLLEGSSSPGVGEYLLVSHDDGATFSQYTAPPNVACAFEEGPTPVVWAHCATGMMSGDWRSADGGAHFETATGSGAARLPELPNSAAFGAASPTTAVTGFKQLYRTTDGGATWSTVPTPAGVSDWSYIGFTDETHGVAVGYLGTGRTQAVYYTTDGGASYHPVPIQ